ncbi:MAG: hypothetical protein WC593_00570 [Methanoregula sp.]
MFFAKASGGAVAVASVMETLRTVPETSRAMNAARPGLYEIVPALSRP